MQMNFFLSRIRLHPNFEHGRPVTEHPVYGASELEYNISLLPSNNSHSYSKRVECRPTTERVNFVD